MPNQAALPNPALIIKLVLWISVVAPATLLPRRRKVTSSLRLAFLVGCVLLFGFVFGQIAGPGANPSPVFSTRNLLASALVRRQLVTPVAAMLAALLLLLVWVSNKSICGWGCQLGLLQDLIHRAPAPKWKPPFWFSNAVRAVAFIALVVGLAVCWLDWVGVIGPFEIFQLHATLWIGLFAAALLLASLFVYRPWCHFLCPFGLLGWLVEQVSLLRPRIDR